MKKLVIAAVVLLVVPGLGFAQDYVKSYGTAQYISPGKYRVYRNVYGGPVYRPRCGGQGGQGGNGYGYGGSSNVNIQIYNGGSEAIVRQAPPRRRIKW